MIPVLEIYHEHELLEILKHSHPVAKLYRQDGKVYYQCIWNGLLVVGIANKELPVPAVVGRFTGILPEVEPVPPPIENTTQANNTKVLKLVKESLLHEIKKREEEKK